MSNELTANDSLFLPDAADAKPYCRPAHECIMPHVDAPVETQAPPARVAFKGSKADKKIQAALVKELERAPYSHPVEKSRKSLLSVASGVTFAMISPIPTAPGVAMMMVAQGLKTPNVEMKFDVDIQHKGLLSLIPKLEVKLEDSLTTVTRNNQNPDNEHHRQPANPLSIRGQNRTLRTMYGKDEMRRNTSFIPDPNSASFTERLQQQADEVKRSIG